MTITREEVRDMAEKMMAAKRAVEEEWKAGKRDGCRLQVYALASDVLFLLEAIEKDDANAYKNAAHEARDHAGNAVFHAICWVNKVREEDRPATTLRDQNSPQGDDHGSR